MTFFKLKKKKIITIGTTELHHNPPTKKTTHGKGRVIRIKCLFWSLFRKCERQEYYDEHDECLSLIYIAWNHAYINISQILVLKTMSFIYWK